MMLTGDCLVQMRTLADNSIDAVVTDPPWNLRFMQKKWDYQLPSVEIWREVMRVLKPGGHALICCGTRTQHRMVVNVEDAGFEVRDICLHIFGSGFPKSHNISVAIDKLYGAEREVVGKTQRTYLDNPDSGSPKGISRSGESMFGIGVANDKFDRSITAPSTPDAIKWQGWGSALKPAVELWTLVRKPLSEPSIAANVLKWGTGGLNIDASRIGSDGGKPNVIATLDYQDKTDKNGTAKFRTKNVIHDDTVQGRFPANLILGCACESEVHEPDCPVRLLDRQSGMLHLRGNKKSTTRGGGMYGHGTFKGVGLSESGHTGASRFFYCAKASKGERNHGLEGMPLKNNDCHDNPNRMFSKDADAEMDRSTRKPNQNHHPTVKPIRLMEYLIRMITPPGGRVLDPFAGSGSTLVAAKRLGFEFIGIEIDAEYVAIAEKRVAAVCL